MPIQDVVLRCLNGHLINQSSIKNTENNRQSCDTVLDGDEIKTPLYCQGCERPYPFKALIEMVKYFELNAENAED